MSLGKYGMKRGAAGVSPDKVQWLLDLLDDWLLELVLGEWLGCSWSFSEES